MRIYLVRFSVWMGRVGSCNSRDEERERKKGEERESFIYNTYMYLPTLCVKNEREVVRRIK